MLGDALALLACSPCDILSMGSSCSERAFLGFGKLALPYPLVGSFPIYISMTSSISLLCTSLIIVRAEYLLRSAAVTHQFWHYALLTQSHSNAD